jgi:hypothetical protein
MSCFEADKENMSQQSNEDDGLDDFMDDVFSQKIVDDVSILLPILPVNTSQSGVTMDFSNVATQQVAPTAPENYVNMSDVATQPSEYNLEFEDIATQKDTDISNRAQDNIPGRYNTTSPYSSQVDNADEDDNNDELYRDNMGMLTLTPPTGLLYNTICNTKCIPATCWRTTQCKITRCFYVYN